VGNRGNTQTERKRDNEGDDKNQQHEHVAIVKLGNNANIYREKLAGAVL